MVGRVFVFALASVVVGAMVSLLVIWVVLRSQPTAEGVLAWIDPAPPHYAPRTGPRLRELAEPWGLVRADDQRLITRQLAGRGFFVMQLELLDSNPREPSGWSTGERAYVTRLGWPFAAVKTSNHDIGDALCSSFLFSKPGNDISIRDWLSDAAGIRIEPGGLFLNMMLFGLPVFALLSFAHRQRRQVGWRRVWGGALVASVSLWLVLAVGSALHAGRIAERLELFTTPEEFARAVAPAPVPAGSWDEFSGTRTQWWGVTTWGYWFGNVNRTANFVEHMVDREESMAVGWPLRCIETSLPIGIGSQADGLWHMQAGAIRWHALVLNWLFLGGLVVAVWRGPRAAWRGWLKRRRQWREKRNLCPNCAYPKGLGSRCTECGLGFNQSENRVSEA